RRRHTRFSRDWSSDVCSSDLNSTSETKAGKLSMSRPFAGNSRDKYTAWMPNFIEWAQNEGIDLEFIANTDLHFQPGILDPYHLRSEERRVGKGGWSRGDDYRE